MADPVRRNVDACSKWIEEDEKAHELARALRAGVPEMRRLALEGKFMLPNPGDEEYVEIAGQRISLYELRVNRSDLPNPWADTIRNNARLPFSSAFVLDGWDEELQGEQIVAEDGKVTGRKGGWVSSIDNGELSIDQYGAEVFEDKLFEGVAYSFVDNDPRTFASVADRRAAGARPYVTKLLRGDIRRVTIEFRNGVPRLKQLVFKQPITQGDTADPNNWTEDCLDGRKVVTAGDPDSKEKDLRRVRTQLYVPNDSGWQEDTGKRGFIIPDNPLEELLDIPLVPHYAKRTGAFRGVSPYLDTAWTEQVVWCHNSELIGLARESSLTYVHESGVILDQQTQTPVLGDTRNLRYRFSTDPNAKLEIVENPGTSLKSLQAFIEWKAAYIEKAHHQINMERPSGPVTAREITLEGVHASSFLDMMVVFEEAAWTRILSLLALLGGLPKRGTVKLAHDFGLPNSGMERNHQLFLAGRMSPDNYWPEAKRAGDVDERGFDEKFEIEWARKNNAAPGGLLT